jgi:5-methylcytosine-specific restriction endonuclease McrA
MQAQTLIDGAQLVTRHDWRRQIFEAWTGKCAYCGAQSQSIDHILARSRGGLHVTQNCVPACLACNGSKSDREVLSWWRPRPGWSSFREQRLLEWVAGTGHGVEPSLSCGAQQPPAASETAA